VAGDGGLDPDDEFLPFLLRKGLVSVCRMDSGLMFKSVNQLLKFPITKLRLKYADGEARVEPEGVELRLCSGDR
jgi:hypothetical protein